VQALALRGTKRFFVQRSTFPTSGSVDWGQTWYPDVLGRMGLKKKALQAISSFGVGESWKTHKWQRKKKCKRLQKKLDTVERPRYKADHRFCIFYPRCAFGVPVETHLQI